MKVRFAVIIGVGTAILLSVGFGLSWYFSNHTSVSLRSPFATPSAATKLPLLAYTFPALRTRSYQASSISILSALTTQPEFTSYLFSYTTMGKTMSGQLNIPSTVTATTPVIVMVRGYVPQEIYSTGVGTKNGAAAFAKAGFITIAPDFFSYGQSDPEPADIWQARFEKPIAVIELIKTIRENGVPLKAVSATATSSTALGTSDLFKTTRVGLWGHSNGGQIALSTLVIMREPIPTSLWAPVSVPFPYSLLFFTDEDADEGKSSRKWIAQFEEEYDARQFSFTDYLDGLAGPVQLHHGTSDEAALKTWSDEFVEKLKNENVKRAKLTQNPAAAATMSGQLLTPIEYHYYTYPGADHNLQPAENWQKVVDRDIAFFKEKLE